MLSYTTIVRSFFFYVVVTGFCILLWLLYGFNNPIVHDAHNYTTLMAFIGYINQSKQLLVSTTTTTSMMTMTTALQAESSSSSSSTDDNCRLILDVEKFKHRKQVTYHQPFIDASCDLLRMGNKLEVKRSKKARNEWKSDISDRKFLRNLHHNCSELRREFESTFYSSKQEKSFPIAFEMLVYYKETRVHQYIRLLKYLYRSQNVYCIHIDRKSPKWWRDELTAFASCFPNIIIAGNPVDIKYATATILYAHLRCLKALLQSSIDWKYVITLHATEVPLVTNREIVDRLMLLNGLNFINKGVAAGSANSQVHDWMKYKVISVKKGTWVVLSDQKLSPVPHNITVYKSGSSANSALCREFVKFVFKSQVVKDFLLWLKDVHSAVEFFFSTVNQMKEAPGHNDMTAELAHREWSHEIAKNHKLCAELKIVHDICIVSLADLPRLTQLSNSKAFFFFNKYFIQYDHIVMDCMEELLLKRNIKEYEMDCGDMFHAN